MLKRLVGKEVFLELVGHDRFFRGRVKAIDQGFICLEQTEGENFINLTHIVSMHARAAGEK